MKNFKFIFIYIMVMGMPALVYAQSSNWKAPQKADTLHNPYTIDQPLLTLGGSTFKSNCETCHGTQGKGNGPAAVALNPRPANLQSKAVQNESEGALFWKISHGKNGMPNWSSSLSVKQRWAVVTYIESLTKPKSELLTQNQNHGKKKK